MLQDVLNCLLLAETVYRVHDHSNTEVARIFDSLRQDFPSSLLTVERLQWSQPNVAHRYFASCIAARLTELDDQHLTLSGGIDCSTYPRLFNIAHCSTTSQACTLNQ